MTKIEKLVKIYEENLLYINLMESNIDSDVAVPESQEAILALVEQNTNIKNQLIDLGLILS